MKRFLALVTLSSVLVACAKPPVAAALPTKPPAKPVVAVEPAAPPEPHPDYLSLEGWLNDVRPANKIVKMLVDPFDAHDGKLTVQIVQGNGPQRVDVWYAADQRDTVLSFLEFGPAHVWARSRSNAGVLDLMKIEVPSHPADKLVLRGKLERGLKRDEVIEGDFQVSNFGSLVQCKGAEQPLSPVDFGALALEFPHWPKEDDKSHACFHARVKCVHNDQYAQSVRVLEITKDGVTEALPTDGILRSKRQILRHGVAGSKAKLRTCRPSLNRSTITLGWGDRSTTIDVPKDLTDKVNELVDQCVELDLSLTSAPVPISRKRVWTTEFDARIVASLAAISVLEPAQPLHAVDESPSAIQLKAWRKQAIADWPKSKGRTFVVDDYTRSKGSIAFDVPPGLMLRFESVTQTGAERPAKLKLAVDDVDAQSHLSLKLVQIIDNGLPGLDPTIPLPTTKSLGDVLVWLAKRRATAVGETFEIRERFASWAGSLVRVDHIHDFELSPAAKRQLEELVEGGQIGSDVLLSLIVKHTGYKFATRHESASRRPVAPALVVQSLSLVPTERKKAQELHHEAPTFFPLLRAGMAAKGRVFEVSVGPGRVDSSDMIRFSECKGIGTWAPIAVPIERKDQWPLVDLVNGAKCSKVKILVESVHAADVTLDPLLRYRVKFLAVERGEPLYGLQKLYTYAAPSTVFARGPWLVLANGVWGRLAQDARMPVWIPVDATDEAARRWLEELNPTDRNSGNETVRVQAGPPKKHPSGFMYIEGQRLPEP